MNSFPPSSCIKQDPPLPLGRMILNSLFSYSYCINQELLWNIHDDSRKPCKYLEPKQRAVEIGMCVNPLEQPHKSLCSQHCQRCPKEGLYKFSIYIYSNDLIECADKVELRLHKSANKKNRRPSIARMNTNANKTLWSIINPKLDLFEHLEARKWRENTLPAVNVWFTVWKFQKVGDYTGR